MRTAKYVINTNQRMLELEALSSVDQCESAYGRMLEYAAAELREDEWVESIWLTSVTVPPYLQKP